MKDRKRVRFLADMPEHIWQLRPGENEAVRTARIRKWFMDYCETRDDDKFTVVPALRFIGAEAFWMLCILTAGQYEGEWRRIPAWLLAILCPFSEGHNHRCDRLVRRPMPPPPSEPVHVSAILYPPHDPNDNHDLSERVPEQYPEKKVEASLRHLDRFGFIRLRKGEQGDFEVSVIAPPKDAVEPKDSQDRSGAPSGLGP